MLLAADIGNSSISFGLFDEDGTLRHKSKVSAEKTRTADEYAVLVSGLLSLHGVSAQDVTDCVLSSVVPTLTRNLRSALHALFGVQALEVGPGIRTGLNIRIESQAELGADLVANAVAALALFSPPVVVVDVGTATTFTVLDGSGALEGAVIAPGLRMSMDALSAGASELPDVSLVPPKRLIGKNSRESMNIGVLYGHAFLIDGFLERFRGAFRAQTPTAVATGGLAETVLPFCRAPMTHCPDLTLQGLYLLWKRNRGPSADAGAGSKNA